MRYAILSDVHGNLEALTALLAFLAAQQVDRYLCLGDIMGYGADPVACLEALQRTGALMIAGNHDMACVGKLALSGFHEIAQASLTWTREQLSVADLDALRRLPLTATEGPCTLVHGSLTHPERFEYLADPAKAVETMAVSRTLFCLVGHTHVPCVMEYHLPTHRLTRMLSASDQLADVPFLDEPSTLRYLANPGSVGQPRDGDPRASGLVIDTERRRMAVHRVAYDVAAAQRKIRAAGLPELLADRLALGR